MLCFFRAIITVAQTVAINICSLVQPVPVLLTMLPPRHEWGAAKHSTSSVATQHRPPADSCKVKLNAVCANWQPASVPLCPLHAMMHAPQSKIALDEDKWQAAVPHTGLVHSSGPLMAWFAPTILVS